MKAGILYGPKDIRLGNSSEPVIGPDVAEGAHMGAHTLMGAKTVNQWREDYLRDFAERMDHCNG